MSEPDMQQTPTDDIRPVVRTSGSGNLTVWLVGGGLALGGLLLFNALETRRQAMVASTDLPVVRSSGTIARLPPLNVPQRYLEAPQSIAEGRTPTQAMSERLPPPQIVTRIIERTVPALRQPESRGQFQNSAPVPEVIESPALAQRTTAVATADNDRVMAGRLANPAFTVPQGTIIAAVLETALDSTRAGGVRAIVSRDVHSFDGSRILIPRGSRLYGEYTSDLSAGQKRALVRWLRLTRPDAVIINLNSPAADPLGRAGVKGKVDSHFFERFGGAILQTALDVGGAIASRSIVDYPVIVALPGSTQQVTAQQSKQVQPTLKVRQGTSVSVFVARDLDFSSVDR